MDGLKNIYLESFHLFPSFLIVTPPSQPLKWRPGGDKISVKILLAMFNFEAIINLNIVS